MYSKPPKDCHFENFFWRLAEKWQILKRGVRIDLLVSLEKHFSQTPLPERIVWRSYFTIIRIWEFSANSQIRIENSEIRAENSQIRIWEFSNRDWEFSIRIWEFSRFENSQIRIWEFSNPYSRILNPYLRILNAYLRIINAYLRILNYQRILKSLFEKKMRIFEDFCG